MIIRMKKIFNLMFAATLIGAVNVLSSFKMACDDQETATQNDTTVQKVVHEGEAVVEMVNTIHHGENRGSKPVVLYMFYLSQKDLPLAVQHSEIPLE